MARRALMIGAISAGLLGGCVERTLTVTSDPPGALVYINDQEIGRTPVTRDFLWYGNLDVAVRKPGYETLKLKQPLIAPWFDWVPMDLVAEVLPVHAKVHKEFHYVLTPSTNRIVSPEALIERGQQLAGELESSKFTRPPATHPAATTPAAPSPSGPATRPAASTP